MSNGLRHQLKPSTPSGAARFSYINRSGKYDRDKEDLVYSADHNMPAFARGNGQLFWESADEYERSNARICLEIELNLPQELKTVAQQIAVVEKYIAQIEKQAGRFPTSYAIHSDKNGKNPHVHFMFSERNLDGIERPAAQFFKWANSKKPEKGGTKKSTWWHKRQSIFWSRAAWAGSCNEVLKESGFKPRFDPRSKAEQRAEAIQNGDLVRAVELSSMTEKHEGAARGGIRKRLSAGDLQRDEVQPEVLELLDSNDFVKFFNQELYLFAATGSEGQLSAFLECNEAVERVAFLAKLYTPAPTAAPDLDVELKDLEHDYEREPQQAPVQASAHSGRLQEHIEYLHVVQSRENNQLLQDTISRSKQSQVQGRAGNLFDSRDALRTAAQPLDTASSRAVRDVRSSELAAPSLAELEKAYIKANREAADAELSQDFKEQDLKQLKDRAEQLIELIEEAKPRWFKKPFIKAGLLEDRTVVLGKQIPPLLKQITETEKEVRELSGRASSLRVGVDRLYAKLDALQVTKPKVTPAQAQTVPADFAEYLEKLKAEMTDAKVESKRQSPQAQDSQAKRPSPRRGPKL